MWPQLQILSIICSDRAAEVVGTRLGSNPTRLMDVTNFKNWEKVCLARTETYSSVEKF